MKTDIIFMDLEVRKEVCSLKLFNLSSMFNGICLESRWIRLNPKRLALEVQILGLSVLSRY